jgi:phosphoribosyl-ATP pyrophosphohydrolase
MKKIRTTNQLRKKNGSYARAGKVIDVVDGKAPFIELPSAYSGSPLHSAQTRLRQPTTAVLEQLSGALAEVTEADHPRTFKLLQSGRHKLSRKLIEEACEVTVEAVRRDSDAVVRESADLLYHLIVLWFHLGIEPVEIWREMQARAGLLGIAEKRPKPPGSNGTADEIDH